LPERMAAAASARFFFAMFTITPLYLTIYTIKVLKESF